MSAEDTPLMDVRDAAQLAMLIERLETLPRFAVDTESNSMHAYHERVCLLQISTPDFDAIVDPLAVDIAPLGKLIASSAHEKIFHGADYDVLSLKRAYGFEFARLFDTMLAARVLGWPQYGLATILRERFGVTLDKRYQRHDWGARPLSDEALAYARLDTRFLLALRDQQVEELEARDRLDEALHLFERQSRVVPKPRVVDLDRCLKVKGAMELDDRRRAVLRSLYAAREEIAAELDVPPFRVMPEGVLLYLARKRPTSGDAVASIRGIPAPVRAKFGDRIVAAIVTGMEPEAVVPKKSKASRIEKEVVARFDRLRAWRKQLASTRGVEPDVILGKDTLMDVAKHHPRGFSDLEQLSSLDDWERARYGEALLEVLADTPAAAGDAGPAEAPTEGPISEPTNGSAEDG